MTGFAPPVKRPPPAVGKTGLFLQRKCAACGGRKPVGGSCATCDKDGGVLMRRSPSGESEGLRGEGQAPPIVHEVLRSSGQPLGASERAFFEPRFGHDFSGVRVHTDARAQESARSVGARAYTVGRDIVFAHGHYSPTTDIGRAILAHELAHVVQQHGGVDAAAGKLEIGPADCAAEREADSVARAIDKQPAFDVRSRIGVNLLRAGPDLGATPLTPPPDASRAPLPPDAAPAREPDTGVDHLPSPKVKLGNFRNSGTASAENKTAYGKLALGVDKNTGLNFMELRGDITGHVAGAEYDIKRTVEDASWAKTDGKWVLLDHEGPGIDDDSHNTDEDLIPDNNHIYALDGPGLKDQLSGFSYDGATEIAYKLSFFETCNVKVGTGIWTKQSNDFPWHSVTWLEKTGAGKWHRKAAKNKIAAGAITVGEGEP